MKLFAADGYNPFEHNHIVFKNARIKTKEHEFAGCYFVYYEIYRHFLGVEKNGTVEAINLDFVIRIREFPKNKKGKKKSLVLD